MECCFSITKYIVTKQDPCHLLDAVGGVQWKRQMPGVVFFYI